MKHVVTLYELESIVGDSELVLISYCEGGACKAIQLALDKGVAAWVVWHDSAGGHLLHLSKHTCLNDAIDQYNEI